MNVLQYSIYFFISFVHYLISFFVSYHVQEEVDFQSLPRSVFVPGSFGYQGKTYFKQIKNAKIANISPTRTLHDRAVELHGCIIGKKIIQYANEKKAKGWEKGLIEDWSNDNKITLIGHGTGGNTIVYLLDMIQNNQVQDSQGNVLTMSAIENVIFISTPLGGMDASFCSSPGLMMYKKCIDFYNEWVPHMIRKYIWSCDTLREEHIYTSCSSEECKRKWISVYQDHEESLLDRKIPVMFIMSMDPFSVTVWGKEWKLPNPRHGLYSMLWSIITLLCVLLRPDSFRVPKKELESSTNDEDVCESRWDEASPPASPRITRSNSMSLSQSLSLFKEKGMKAKDQGDGVMSLSSQVFGLKCAHYARPEDVYCSTCHMYCYEMNHFDTTVFSPNDSYQRLILMKIRDYITSH